LYIGSSDVRQIEIYTAEPLVPEISIAKLKRYKSPGSDQILAELIQAGGEILHYKIHKLSNSIWNKEELPDRWTQPIIIRIQKKDDKTDCSIHVYIYSIRKNTETLTDAIKEVGLEVNAEKTKYMLLSHRQNAGCVARMGETRNAYRISAGSQKERVH
jgi:hypothetical protein